MKALASAAFVASLAAASAAHAVVVPFGGAATGTDPLGHSWVASNSAGSGWGEPGLGLGSITFNPGDLSSGAGDWANRFSFIFLEGVTGSIDAAATTFQDITTGQTWSAAFFNAGPTPNQRVEFTAPGASKISPFDKFIIRVGYVTPVSPTRYSWSASWDNTFVGVPEPATWGLMIGGFGLAGIALRRRRAVAA